MYVKEYAVLLRVHWTLNWGWKPWSEFYFISNFRRIYYCGLIAWYSFHSQFRNNFERLKELAVIYVLAIKRIAVNREQKTDDAISRHRHESAKLNGGINKWPANLATTGDFSSKWFSVRLRRILPWPASHFRRNESLYISCTFFLVRVPPRYRVRHNKWAEKILTWTVIYVHTLNLI